MANPAMNMMADLNSLFFLNPSENPGLILVSSPLTETNYHAWCRAMTMALVSKNKLRFADDSIVKLEYENPLRIPWERNNTIVLTWILRSLSPENYQSILYMD